jgi:hypothetical protein
MLRQGADTLRETPERDKPRVGAPLPWFAALQPVRRTIAASPHPTGDPPCGSPKPEAVMSDTLTRQHPAVVLRSHYLQLRALLAIALVAIVALSVTVVVLATSHQAPPAPASTGDDGH